MQKRKGFTLLEIMLVVGLVGVIATAALAPLVFITGSLKDAQKEWGNNHNLSSAAAHIKNDILHIIPSDSFKPFKIVHQEGLSQQNDDRLILWCDNLVRSKPSGTPGVVVYKVVKTGGMKNVVSGLYRWEIIDNRGEKSEMAVEGAKVTSGDNKEDSNDTILDATSPMTLNTDDLDIKEATRIIADIDGLKLSLKENDEWKSQSYDGDIPAYLLIQFFKGDDEILREAGRYF